MATNKEFYDPKLCRDSNTFINYVLRQLKAKFSGSITLHIDNGNIDELNASSNLVIPKRDN